MNRPVLSASGRGLDTVLPAIFHLVHRGVRRLYQFVCCHGHIGKRSHADGRGEVNNEAVCGQKTVPGDTVADTLGYGLSLIHI